MERVIGIQEGFFAVQDGRVRGASEISETYVECPQVCPEGRLKGWVRVPLEFGIKQVGDLPILAVQFDHIRRDGAGEDPPAAYVHAQQWREGRDGCGVEVHRVRQ